TQDSNSPYRANVNSRKPDIVAHLKSTYIFKNRTYFYIIAKQVLPVAQKIDSQNKNKYPGKYKKAQSEILCCVTHNFYLKNAFIFSSLDVDSSSKVPSA